MSSATGKATLAHAVKSWPFSSAADSTAQPEEQGAPPPPQPIAVHAPVLTAPPAALQSATKSAPATPAPAVKEPVAYRKPAPGE